ncbi:MULTISPECIES: carboxyl transferase domain-containing protein [unclassified Streptomyces]|uniref:carboxyl transferase domain-containing protein n=1 Tax=unclassified Streptomyces TaxID=2593676 RepID=UPI002476D82B|nr:MULTISPECIES: carboxyl transferase domain-containing protein [unclassified Streptomyces]MDH6449882.1 acetyl-CoA carboxylase alpha subunit [Streptomyces sp. SAI-119]MDH6499668.1 acetyl-CoA carboxylase alpha subunit [Streptomyces sp. SAI-149]
MAERLSAREVVALVADDFTEIPYPERQSRPDGPLAWQCYDDARARAAERTGEQESVVCGTAHVEGTPAVLIAFEFGFLGGSLGERTGDRLEAAYTYARAHRLPVVPLVATGGSRMQEGMLALTQLQRVARQSALTREAGLPQIAVLRDPTTGGGWATLGAGADVILALPDAQVGFAGSRVRPPNADPTAYTAQAQVASGAADTVVPAAALRETLGQWLRLLGRRASGRALGLADAGAGTARGTADAAGGTAPEPVDAIGGTSPGPADTAEGASRGSAGAAGGTAAPGPMDATGTTVPAPADAVRVAPPVPGVEPAPVPRPLGVTDLPGTGWDAVLRARSPRRPRAGQYLDAYFSHRVAISGDRCGGTDPGMLCGFGEHEGRTVAYAAQTGTATRPAGYRTATRLIRLADRLGIPVLTLVDTPGAANDAEAERQGAGAAIAELFTTVASARTPITTLLIGEGGSGGALALAAPGTTYATPDSYFSVIAPELAAAILKRPPEEAETTANHLRIRPQDLVELGVVAAADGRTQS